MPSVVHFEICVDDLERATEFYSKVFGWHIDAVEEGSNYVSIVTDDGAEVTGGLTLRYDEWDSTVNTIDVESVDEFAKRVVAAGGKVIAPKITISGVGYLQYCKDIEGNSFGIMEFDSSAAQG
jgi:predicted enzyme related to lactoylglutathione lyase